MIDKFILAFVSFPHPKSSLELQRARVTQVEFFSQTIEFQINHFDFCGDEKNKFVRKSVKIVSNRVIIINVSSW